MKNAYGDDVDALLIVSRTHYSRIMTTLRGTEGAAQQFLYSPLHTPHGAQTSYLSFPLPLSFFSPLLSSFFTHSVPRH
jgi:hypothetical protein